ncbi:F-box/LRR-repeat protein like [Capsicum chacoense]
MWLIYSTHRFANSILIHILSMLWESKEVVRTSVLSWRWQFLWMTVPASLRYMFYHCKTKEDTLDKVALNNRELYYRKSCEKIRKFVAYGIKYVECYAKDIDLWVHFATKVANVEEFFLGIMPGDQKYEFPRFAHKNARLRNLTLRHCQLNPCGSFHCSSLVSLSIGLVELTDGVMETVLSGCPNLECLELFAFWGIQHLEISSVKLRKLTVESYFGRNHDPWLEILAPYIQCLQLKGFCRAVIRIRQRNVASLVTAVLHLHIVFEDEKRNLENQYSYLKELLHSVAHAENLELSLWCIKDRLEFPGICSFLQSSSDLETLVIYGSGYNRISSELLSKYTNEDEQRRKFETHYCNGSFLHLKTIKFIDCFGPPSINKSVLLLVKYLLKHATALEKFFITNSYKKIDVSGDFVRAKQELLSLPRSSPRASFIFCKPKY